MDISKVINVKHINLNMYAQNKEEAIEELTDLLVKNNAIINKDEFLRDVWLREEQGATGFENHIALPHGVSSGVSHTSVAIGKINHPILWDIIDNISVSFIILYAVSLNNNDPNISVLTSISCSLADDIFIDGLLKESDPENIIKIIKDKI